MFNSYWRYNASSILYFTTDLVASTFSSGWSLSLHCVIIDYKFLINFSYISFLSSRSSGILAQVSIQCILGHLETRLIISLVWEAMQKIWIFVVWPNWAVSVFDWLQVNISLPLRKLLWPFIRISMDIKFQLHGWNGRIKDINSRSASRKKQNQKQSNKTKTKTNPVYYGY